MRRNTPRVVTQEMAYEIRRQYKRGIGYEHLAGLHDISPSTVSVIVRGLHAYTEGMADLSRGRGRPCNHARPQGRRRCVHAQLNGRERAAR